MSLILHVFKEEVEKLRGGFVTVATDLDTHKSIKIPQDILNALTFLIITQISNSSPIKQGSKKFAFASA